MKYIRNTFTILIGIWIVLPIVLNAYNMFVNRDQIALFVKRNPDATQLRPKNLFFIDGRFEGFEANIGFFKGGIIYYILILECNYNPDRTLLRLKTIKKKNGASEVIGNISFTGGLKYEILTKGMSDYYTRNSIRLFSEEISTKEEFMKLVESQKRNI